MLFRPAKWLVVLALVLTTGSNWLALQSIGWVSMVVSYSQTDSIDVAIQKTFDGKHPCRICKSAAAGRQSEQKQTTLKVETKLEFCLCESIVLPLPPIQPEHRTFFDGSYTCRGETPPTPPPRTV